MKVDDIKPCPFCGSKPVYERIKPHKHHFGFMPDYPGSFIVNCNTCEIRMFSHESQEDVLRKWNNRT